MYSINVLLLLSFALLTGETLAMRDLRIHHGSDAKIREFPHQVSIRKGDIHYCGGTIIDDRHILTAAHCIVDLDYKPFKSLVVNAGTTSSYEEGYLYEIADKVVHPKYELDSDYITAVNDIGIIKLKTPIQFDAHRQPIKLPTCEPASGVRATTIGWGQTDSDYHPEILQKLNVTVLTARACQPLLISKIYDTQVCAQHGDGRGVCFGDSGGPLIVDGTIVGITSWVEQDVCASNFPDVYTNVYAFLDFIESYVNQSVHECSFVY